MRAGICSRLALLGVEVDGAANAAVEGEAEIGLASAAVRVHVVTAREDVVVARACRTVST
jgi:acetate kinase